MRERIRVEKIGANFVRSKKYHIALVSIPFCNSAGNILMNDFQFHFHVTPVLSAERIFFN